MTPEELKTIWEQEERIARIQGWDFSHINGRYEEEDSLPWDYEEVVRELLRDDMKLLDYDTGGGEFLLSLHHPYENTAATEGYPPNVELCRERLLPLGIDLRECADASHVPFDDRSFDIIINRHGDLSPAETRRLLKPGGLFVTQQVGSENDRDLVEAVLPGLEKPFPHNNLKEQRKAFEEAGFDILRAEEAYGPIRFFDVGAFVWFAHIIEWEFPGFSVENCFDRLLQLQKTIETNGSIEGTTHRFLLVAQKPVTCADSKMYALITLRDRPDLKEAAAQWFNSKWGVPVEAYLECMEAYLNRETDYGWYLCLDGDRIVGGMGVIENDFHDRKDLTPNVCAVYTEEEYRRQGIAGRLLDMVVEDLRAKGISPVYLVTDHTGFYERYGWEFLCMVQGDGEPEMSRMYIHR